jgi:hypothetical protein
VEIGERCVGEPVFSERNVETVVFSGIVFMGLSSGVGVDTGELVSWLELS